MPGYYSHIIVNADSPYTRARRRPEVRQVARLRYRRSELDLGLPGADLLHFRRQRLDPKTCFKTVRNANHQANALAVANKQVAAATNNSEDLQRLATTAPDARKQIQLIWTSPLIPLDPLMWRKDLDPAVKAKLYTFLMSYGRIGTAEEIKTASANSRRPDVVAVPSLVRQPVAADPHARSQQGAHEDQRRRQAVGDGEGAEVDELQAESRSRRRVGEGRAQRRIQKQVAAFVEAEKAGNKDELKKMIAEFAAGSTVNAPTN